MKFISIQAQMAKVQKIKLVLIFYKEFYFLPLFRTAAHYHEPCIR